MVDPTVLDEEQLAALRTLQLPGEPDVLAMLFEEFRQESQSHMHQLRLALANRDAQALGRTAHALKSGSASLGASALATICAEIEATCTSGEPPAEAAGLVTRAEAEYARVLLALEAVVRG